MSVGDGVEEDDDGWQEVKKTTHKPNRSVVKDQRRAERNAVDRQLPVAKWHHPAAPLVKQMTPSSIASAKHIKNQGLVAREDWATGPTISVPPFALVSRKFLPHLDLFRTEGCRSLKLETDQLILRQVELSDLSNLQKIKTEPTVQKTQLYGSPSSEDCRIIFLNSYIRSSMPRVIAHSSETYRDFVFAITLKDPESVNLNPPSNIRLANALSSARGYIGNIGLSLGTRSSKGALQPQKGVVYTHPTFDECSRTKLVGSMYYELHPQLWGKGLMSEAFEEVLRFAMEEIGCETLACDPTTSNVASVKLCEKSGLKYSHTSTDNDYRKPQAFHKISRKDWWTQSRPREVVESKWAGKVVCRWCMNFRLEEAQEKCDGCDWARYCSFECRRADWKRTGGHQSECDRL